MNKKQIDALIPKAYEVLKTVKIADENDTIDKAWRGQISAFGAAVATGSLLSAVSFFSAQGGSALERQKLMTATFQLLDDDKKGEGMDLFEYVVESDERQAKEEIINRTIALKLAMNLYKLVKKGADANASTQTQH